MECGPRKEGLRRRLLNQRNMDEWQKKRSKQSSFRSGHEKSERRGMGPGLGGLALRAKALCG